MSMQENVFLQESDILVTNARIRLHGGKTFAMANVTSVLTKIEEFPIPPAPSKAPAGCIITLGILFVLGALAALSEKSVGAGAVLFLLAALLLFAGVKVYKAIKRPERENPDYILMIGSASGESEGMRSKDKALIARISDAINEAMIARG